jgi:pimeloyl-ACP methyl ester carboxylesterase
MELKSIVFRDGAANAVQAGQGPDLVILHSLLTDRHSFDKVLPTLARTARVSVFNLPGFHGSKPIEGTVRAYADWIRDGLDAAGVTAPATVLGNGFGGSLALGFATHYPERISRLVISDAAGTFPESGKQPFRVMIEKVRAGGLGTIVDIAANRVFHAAYLKANPGAIAERKAALLGIDPVAFEASCRLLIDADLLPALGRLNIPTTVICGELDAATPVDLNVAVARAIPSARYIEIPACGHCPPLENPEAFLKAYAA